MELISAMGLSWGLNPQGQNLRLLSRVLLPQRKIIAVQMKIDAQQTVRSFRYTYRANRKVFIMSCAISPGVQNLGMSTTKFKDFRVAAHVGENGAIKIPKDVLLQIIGPSKVNKEAILKVINTTVADYVAKEGLNVTRDLIVEQSYDEIEAAFIPGKEFSFKAIIPVLETAKVERDK